MQSTIIHPGGPQHLTHTSAMPSRPSVLKITKRHSGVQHKSRRRTRFTTCRLRWSRTVTPAPRHRGQHTSSYAQLPTPDSGQCDHGDSSFFFARRRGYESDNVGTPHIALVRLPSHHNLQRQASPADPLCWFFANVRHAGRAARLLNLCPCSCSEIAT